jgi:GWxTD domain-containing protein
MMSQKKYLSACFAFCLLSLSLVAEQKLPPRYQEWLDDVSPIITKTEREIFSRLKTDADREKFIKFFWKQRDPLPDTAENEFYKDYMERIRFADQTFGRGTSRRGSRTERGYYYLLLGAPLERQLFSTVSQIWPLELWFYKGEVEYGLPPYFYLIFFQPQGMGEYRLYSPGTDGPESLAVPTVTAPVLTRARAYQIIRQVNSELGGAALSYLPGEQSLMTHEISSTSVMASIGSYPEKKFSDAYARNYMAYKDYITTEYTDRFIESSFAARVYRNAGQSFVHWALEPGKINFVSRGDRYQAIFDLVLRLEDQEGNLILEKTEEIPLTVNPEQYKAHERQRFAFQDLFPAIPGRFRLFGLLKNKTAQDFSSFNALLSVPAPADNTPAGILLYLGREKMADNQRGGLRAFAFGGEHYLVNAQNNFLPGGELGVFVQFPEIPVDGGTTAGSVLVEVRAVDAGTVALSQRKTLAEAAVAGGEGFDCGTLPLAGLKPGYYSVSATLLGADDQKRASAKENFVLLSQGYPVVPWVYSRVHPSFPNADSLFWLGTQYYLSKRYPEALASAEKALTLRAEPRSRLLTAQALYALGRYEEALTAARPLADAAGGREAAKVMAAAYAARKDWTSALGYLEKLLTEATEVSVLNLAGECYVRLGQPEKALPLLQKSLEINPDQPAIKDMAQGAQAKTK